MRLLATNSHLKTTEKRKLIGYSILASSHLDGNGGKAHASEWFPTDQSDKSLLCSAACNRSHAFAWSVRVGCLISVCTSNVCVILVRRLDTFIHFVRYFCCLNMLECGKYFFPCTTLFPGLNFILTFLQGWDDQNQLLDLERRSASNSVGAALLSLQQELAKPPPVFDSYKALAQLESLVNLARDNADARTKRFSTILHQCSPLLSYGTFVLSKFNMWNRGSTFQNEFYSSNSANKPFLNWMLFSRSRQNLLNQTN